MIKCPHCGELVSADREMCVGCGRRVPDPSRPMEQRLRALVIGAFLLAGLAMIAGMVRDSILHR
jgi:hypothetical protein